MMKVVAKIIACAMLSLVGVIAASAADIKSGTQADVDKVVKSVQQAYPKLRVLCTGDADVIPNAVREAMTMERKTIRSDRNTVMQQATQRIQSGCPY